MQTSLKKPTATLGRFFLELNRVAQFLENYGEKRLEAVDTDSARRLEESGRG